MPQTADEWTVFFFPESIAADDESVATALGIQLGHEPWQAPQAWVGRPFLLNDVGGVHQGVNDFFASPRMRARAKATNRRYAFSLCVWMNFLHARGVEWEAADEDDALDYKFWRLSDRTNPRRISGSAWSSDLAAISLFMDWAEARRGVPAPIDISTLRGRSFRYDGRQASRQAGLRPGQVRQADVKWLSPLAYTRWRDVGIHGIAPDGVERTRWRPRNQARDAAFVDGLYGCGLRLQEWSSVLTSDLTTERASDGYSTFRLADACAKNQFGHPYWLSAKALESVEIYVETERAEAVRRGRAAGLYLEADDTLIVEEATAHRLRFATGVTVQANDLGPRERAKLLVRTDEGLEPLRLWLNEDGTVRPQASWYRAFDRANARVRRAGIERLECHPHMLRHSFALRWYAVGRLIWSRDIEPAGAKFGLDFRDQFGDTWTLLQTMLGHKDVNTTKNTYLEPFRTLEVSLLLQYGRATLTPEILRSILAANQRVRLSDDEYADAQPLGELS